MPTRLRLYLTESHLFRLDFAEIEETRGGLSIVDCRGNHRRICLPAAVFAYHNASFFMLCILRMRA